MKKNVFFKFIIIAIFVIAILLSIDNTAFAVSINGSGSGVTGPNAVDGKGYSFTMNNAESFSGYRFTYIDSNGNKAGVIDVISENQWDAYTLSSMNTSKNKVNKKQLVELYKNGTNFTFSTTKTSWKDKNNKTQYAGIKDEGDKFGLYYHNETASANMKGWTSKAGNINKIFIAMGLSTRVNTMAAGDEILVEPITIINYDGTRYALTLTELWMLAGSEFGYSTCSKYGSNGDQKSYAFIAMRVNGQFPTNFYVGETNSVCEPATALSGTDSYFTTGPSFATLISKGYGLHIIYKGTNPHNNVLTINYYSNYATHAFSGTKNAVGANKNVLTRTWTTYYSKLDTDDTLHDYSYSSASNYLGRTGYKATEYWGTSTTGGTTMKQDYQFGSTADLAKYFGKDLAAGNVTIDLYPQWNKLYNITYDGNGGTWNGQKTWLDTIRGPVTLGQNYTTYNNFFTRPGYTFIGWKDQNGTDWTNDINKPWKWSYTYDVTLYAQWKQNKVVDVVFHKNDGSSKDASQTFMCGQTINKFGYKLDGKTPMWDSNNDGKHSGQFCDWDRAGYVLLGWSEDPSQDANTFKAGESGNYSIYSGVTDSWIKGKCGDNSSATVNLYAVWKPMQVTVVFHRNYGSAGPVQQTFVYEQRINKFGYKLDSITPMWDKNEDGKHSGQFCDWDRTGYKLLGWSENKDIKPEDFVVPGTGNYQTYNDVKDTWIKNKCDKNVSATVHLYAVWDPHKLNVQYNTNTGTLTGTNYTKNTSGLILKESNIYKQVWPYNDKKENGLINNTTFDLYKSGYKFIGWGKTPDAEPIIDNINVFDQNNNELCATKIYPNIVNEAEATVTLYAIWEPTFVNVRFDISDKSDTNYQFTTNWFNIDENVQNNPDIIKEVNKNESTITLNGKLSANTSAILGIVSKLNLTKDTTYYIKTEYISGTVSGTGSFFVDGLICGSHPKTGRVYKDSLFSNITKEGLIESFKLPSECNELRFGLWGTNEVTFQNYKIRIIITEEPFDKNVSLPMSENVLIKNNYNTLRTIERERYRDATKWFSDSTYKNEITSNTVVTNEDNHVLYTRWTPGRVYITYDANHPKAYISDEKNNEFKIDKFKNLPYAVFHANGEIVSENYTLIDSSLPTSIKSNDFFGLTTDYHTFEGWTYRYQNNQGEFEEKFFSINELLNIDFYKDLFVEDGTSDVKGTFYAKWSPFKYNLVYCGNGATSSEYSDALTCSKCIGDHKHNAQVIYNDSLNLEKNSFLNKGYHFNNWIDSIGNKYDELSRIAINENDFPIIKDKPNGYTIILHATWDPNKLIMRYNANGNQLESDIYTKDNGYMIMTKTPNDYYTEIYYGNDFDKKMSFSKPSKFGIYKLGHEFSGWEVKGNRADEYAFVDDTNTTISLYDFCPEIEYKDCEVTLYVDSISSRYKVYYDGNGATTGEMSPSECFFGATYNLKKNAFNKDYYNFSHWVAKSESDGIEYYYGTKDGKSDWYQYNEGLNLKEYTDESSFIDLVYNINGAEFTEVTMVAQWEANTFNVRYRANGGNIYNNNFSLAASGDIKCSSGFDIQTWTIESQSSITLMSDNDFELLNGKKVFSSWTLESIDPDTGINNSRLPIKSELKSKQIINPKEDFPEIKNSNITIYLKAQWDEYHTLTVNYNAGEDGKALSSVYIADNNNNIYNDNNKNGKFDQGDDVLYNEGYQQASFVAKSPDYFGMYASRKSFAYWTISSKQNINAKDAYFNNETINIVDLCPNIFNEDYTITLTANWDTSNKQIKVYYLAPGAKISENASTVFKLNDDGFINKIDGDNISLYIDTYSYSSLSDRDISFNSNSFFEISKQGYSFKYWKIKNSTQTSLNGRLNVSSINTSELRDVLSYSDTCEIYLEAVWEPNKVTVKYEANGGLISSNDNFKVQNDKICTSNGSIYSELTEYGKPYKISDDAKFKLYKDGYKFEGWKNKSTGDIYLPGESVVTDALVVNTNYENEEVTLSAIWKPNILKVYYKVNGGSISSLLYSKDEEGFICKNGKRYYDEIEYIEDGTYIIKSQTDFSLYKLSCSFLEWFNERDNYAANNSYAIEKLAPEILNNNCEVILEAGWDGKVSFEDIYIEYYEGEEVSLERFKNDIMAAAKGIDFVAFHDKNSINYVDKQISKTPVSGEEANIFSENGIYTYFYEIDPNLPGAKAESLFYYYPNGGVTQTRALVSAAQGYLVIKYNNPPEIKATDRYFTLSEAKAGKITMLELLSTASAKDVEDGIITEKLEIVDFNSLTFDSVGAVTVTYTVTDKYRKTTTKTINVHVYDFYDNENTRFISDKYYPCLNNNLKTDNLGNYIAKSINGTLYYLAENGDIATINGEPYRVDAGPKTTIILNKDRTYTIVKTSKWLSSNTCVSLLTNCLNNKKDSEGKWQYVEEVWRYKSEDVKFIKENISKNGYDSSFYHNKRLNGYCTNWQNSLIKMNIFD